MITPKELLDTKLHGSSTLREIFTSHLDEGQFGIEDQFNTDEQEEAFYIQLAEKIISEVK